jgi:hypothetical protein
MTPVHRHVAVSANLSDRYYAMTRGRHLQPRSLPGGASPTDACRSNMPSARLGQQPQCGSG